MSADIRIGTSGWHYKHWVGTFYPKNWPASKMLSYYQERFNTVELNNTFYRLPKPGTVEQWRESTPPDFCFASKGSRFLTHMKKLKDPQAGLEKYFGVADLLRGKLGPILFQLPPNLGMDLERLRLFVDALPGWHRHAFEFRNETWNSPPVYELLRERNIAYCQYHLAGYQSPVEITADITYVRLHGPGGKYQGRYSDEELKCWADRIAAWRTHLKAIYCFFDNDDSGYAAKNALRLREMVGV